MEPAQVSKVQEVHEYSSDFTSYLHLLHPFSRHVELLLSVRH